MGRWGGLGLGLTFAGLLLAQEPGFFSVPGTEAKLKCTATLRCEGGSFLSGGRSVVGRESAFTLVPSRLALRGESVASGQLGLTAAHSRFGFEMTHPAEVGELGLVLQVDGAGRDFHTMQSGPLCWRNAYGTVGDWLLVGLHDSLFRVTDVEPDAVGAVPCQVGGSRTPQIRWMKKRWSGMLAFSLEATPRHGGSREWRTHSLIGRLDVPAYTGACHLRALLIRYEGERQSALGHGLALGGHLFFEADRLAWDVSLGAGLGDFMQGMALAEPPQDAVSTPDHVDLCRSAGASLSYTHVWKEVWRSSVYGSACWSKGEAPWSTSPTLAATANRCCAALGAAIFWEDIPGLRLGVGVNYGFRRSVNGEMGHGVNVGAALTYRVSE